MPVLENGQTIEGAGLLGMIAVRRFADLHNDFNGIVNATGTNALEIIGLQGLAVPSAMSPMTA